MFGSARALDGKTRNFEHSIVIKIIYTYKGPPWTKHHEMGKTGRYTANESVFSASSSAFRTSHLSLPVLAVWSPCFSQCFLQNGTVSPQFRGAPWTSARRSVLSMLSAVVLRHNIATATCMQRCSSPTYGCQHTRRKTMDAIMLCNQKTFLKIHCI